MRKMPPTAPTSTSFITPLVNSTMLSSEKSRLKPDRGDILLSFGCNLLGENSGPTCRTEAAMAITKIANAGSSRTTPSSLTNCSSSSPISFSEIANCPAFSMILFIL